MKWQFVEKERRSNHLERNMIRIGDVSDLCDVSFR
jgi:hypothetical protein